MKKFILSSILFSMTFLPQLANASGLMVIQGKLTSITKSQYVIETAQGTVFLRRSLVSDDQAEKLEKTGANVSVAVPFEAIDVVKNKKTSS